MNFFDYRSIHAHPIFLDECQSPARNKIFRTTIDDHHQYVNYTDVPQRRINYNVYETNSGNLIGAVGISSAVLAISPRDNWIGWDMKTRLANLNSVANNYRFALIRENITIDCVGSQVLKLLRIQGASRWKDKYGDELVLLETYVKPPWTGTVYRADNWTHVGMTKGFSIKKAPVKLWQRENSARGELARKDPSEAIRIYASKKSGQHYNIGKSEPKHIFVRPLCKKWKVLLNTGAES